MSYSYYYYFWQCTVSACAEFWGLLCSLGPEVSWLWLLESEGGASEWQRWQRRREMRVAETSIISLAVCNWILKVFYNPLSAGTRWKASALTRNSGYVRLATEQLLCRAYSGDKNSLAGIPAIVLIQALADQGWLCRKKCLGSRREAVRTVAWAQFWGRDEEPSSLHRCSVYHGRRKFSIFFL